MSSLKMILKAFDFVRLHLVVAYICPKNEVKKVIIVKKTCNKH